MAKEYRLLLSYTEREDSHTIEAYEALGGYQGLRKALEMDPDEIIEEVKKSGLKGRGGASLPHREEVVLHTQGSPRSQVRRG